MSKMSQTIITGNLKVVKKTDFAEKLKKLALIKQEALIGDVVFDTLKDCKLGFSNSQINIKTK